MSNDEKAFKLGRADKAGLVRGCLLFVFPLISVFYSNWIATGAVTGLAVVGVILDRIRNQRRVVSFPMFLLLIWGLQIIVFSLIHNLSYLFAAVNLPNLYLEDPAIAMQKWAEFDKNKVRTQLPWSVALNGTEFPWLQEFPPLSLTDPPPVIATASVILAAHNEQKYLERTINSILEASPVGLVEIIVVDDASEPPLSEIIATMTPNSKVKLLYQRSREGLIRSKTNGAHAATGDLVIFLDAHVKPEPNWLDPLFKHTNENYKRVVTPVIPILNGDTWEVDSKAVGIKMMFDWAMGFNWFDDANDWVPIMSGGLLAITRRWFYEGGEYDDKMLYWGGENIEQSVRTWLCGGEIVVARDSRVSHVFRPTFPYTINHTQVNINKVRTVEVWFDEYKEFYYRSDPYARTLTSYKGEIEQRNLLKSRLGCKPFQFFVDRFRAVFDMKNMLPKRHVAIKDEETGKCLEATKEGNIVLGDCNNAIGDKSRSAMRFVPDFPSTNAKVQVIGTIRSLKYGQKCFDANGEQADKKNSKVLLYTCMAKNKNQESWTVDQGGLRWNEWCTFIDSKTKALTFGDCTKQSAEVFLGKPFHGNANHHFVIVDEQSMEISKSDKEVLESSEEEQEDNADKQEET